MSQVLAALSYFNTASSHLFKISVAAPHHREHPFLQVALQRIHSRWNYELKSSQSPIPPTVVWLDHATKTSVSCFTWGPGEGTGSVTERGSLVTYWPFELPFVTSSWFLFVRSLDSIAAQTLLHFQLSYWHKWRKERKQDWCQFPFLLFLLFLSLMFFFTLKDQKRSK